jgi:DNA polymerase elongation subunit (family B)
MDIFEAKTLEGKLEFFSTQRWTESGGIVIPQRESEHRYVELVKPESPLYKKVVRHINLHSK